MQPSKQLHLRLQWDQMQKVASEGCEGLGIPSCKTKFWPASWGPRLRRWAWAASLPANWLAGQPVVHGHGLRPAIKKYNCTFEFQKPGQDTNSKMPKKSEGGIFLNPGGFFKISGKPLGKLGQFSQGLDPGPAQGLTWASPGLDPGRPRSILLVKILVKQNNRNNSIHCNNELGAREAYDPLYCLGACCCFCCFCRFCCSVLPTS